MLLLDSKGYSKGEAVMYVKEARWYQRQQERRAMGRRITRMSVLIVGLLLIPLCFCALQVWAMDARMGMREANTSTYAAGAEAVGMDLETIGKELKESVWQEYVDKDVDVVRVPAESLEKPEEVDASPENFKNPDTEGMSESTVNVVKEAGRYLIVIDPGHGGEDEGCSFTNVEEKDINLKLARELKQKLEEMNFQVLLTREEDVLLALEERVKLANRVEADAYISIHQNSCEDEAASGVETYYFPTQENLRLAKLVEQYVSLYTKARDRGIREAENLYVIRETNMVSCLVETAFLSNPSERELLQDEAYLEKIAQGLADAVQLYFYPKAMYLTFDDGPVAGNTEKVLDILKEKGIKATFFVVGKNVERNPELAKRIVEEGHTIGIHCYQHDYDVIYKSVNSYLEDFERARQVVYEVTGVEAKLFRFPGGSINGYNKKVYKDIIAEMTAQGYVYFDWNASFEDAVRGVTCEKILQNAKESTLGRKRVVMLAHDLVDKTIECLEEVLELFPEYELLPLDENVEPVRF